jgi:serine/threonine-protein kinase RsbT
VPAADLVWPQRVSISTGEDVVTVRQRARALGQATGFSLLEITKWVTAASELARNALEHGGGGWCLLEQVREPKRNGVRMTFQDDGPGIADVAKAMAGGHSTGGGLGLGLSGSKRLVSDFVLDTAPGKGTKVIVTRWK